MKDEEMYPLMWNSHLNIPSFFEEMENMLSRTDWSHRSGLSISEDDKAVYVEADLPGLQTDEIELSFDKGTVIIKACSKKEERGEKRTFYRKASRSFFYKVNLSGQVNESKEPEASYHNGVLRMTFAKAGGAPPKKIPINKKAA